MVGSVSLGGSPSVSGSPLGGALPAAVAALVAGAGVVGFSGSRLPSAAVQVAASAVVGVLPAGASVLVGCAVGLDSHIAAMVPSARVFAAASFSGSPVARLVQRSVALVRALPVGGLLVAFPSGPCPAGLVPSGSSSACFCGSGSGTWATAAFAAGSGRSVLVFCASAPVGWGASAVAPGWWLVAPAASQPSLF